ncbi:MAG: ATP-binding protein [Chloroflexi bacterium]|nr:ATP-binding protein [Chloroflexota bacterium]
MTDAEQQILSALLAEPREDLNVEIKGWLDFKNAPDKAVLAKAAIALANSGGGIIVLGLSENKSEGATWISEDRPSDLPKYTDDVIGSAIAKYADPMPDYELKFVQHPDTGIQHVFVSVVGGLTEPVIAKKGLDKIIVENRCYVRKLGPARSEEPTSALEWRELFNRCVRNNRTALIDGFRGMLDSRFVAAEVTPDNQEILRKFIVESRERWKLLVQDLPADEPARLDNGAFEFGFALPSFVGLSGPKELSDLMAMARMRIHASYGPFRVRNLETHQPYTFKGALESWAGKPNDPHGFRPHPIGCSFWRATTNGMFYHIEGLFDDESIKDREPARFFEISYAIRRVAAFLLYATTIAEQFDDTTRIMVLGSYSGMRDRILFRDNDHWEQRVRNRSHDDSATLGPKLLLTTSVYDNLDEITYELLREMFQNFWLVDLKPELVSAQVGILKNQGY